MNTWLLVIIALVLACKSLASDVENPEMSENESKEDLMKTFPKKMLARRREEHLLLLKMIAKHDKYEWRFKLVEKGIEKVFELISKNRFDDSINNTDVVSEAKMTIIENACLSMDFIVNFSEDLYKIFNKLQKKTGTDWREILKFSLNFLENNIDLLDELTTKEYDFVKENWSKIINEEPLPLYPYENNITKDINIAERLYEQEKMLLKKEKKKLKKGPTLNTKNEL